MTDQRRQKERQRFRRRRANAKTFGACTDCMTPLVSSDHKKCPKCLARSSKHRNKSRNRSRAFFRSVGLCPECGTLPALGKVHCDACLAKFRQYKKDQAARKKATQIAPQQSTAKDAAKVPLPHEIAERAAEIRKEWETKKPRATSPG